jgi:hypothetical protein
MGVVVIVHLHLWRTSLEGWFGHWTAEPGGQEGCIGAPTEGAVLESLRSRFADKEVRVCFESK